MHFRNFRKKVLSTIRNLSEYFQQMWFFLPNAQKTTSCFDTFLEKYAKLKHFSQFFKEFFESFRRFSQNFLDIKFVVQMLKIITHGLLNIMKNMLN